MIRFSLLDHLMNGYCVVLEAAGKSAELLLTCWMSDGSAFTDSDVLLLLFLIGISPTQLPLIQSVHNPADCFKWTDCLCESIFALFYSTLTSRDISMSLESEVSFFSIQAGNDCH